VGARRGEGCERTPGTEAAGFPDRDRHEMSV